MRRPRATPKGPALWPGRLWSDPQAALAGVVDDGDDVALVARERDRGGPHVERRRLNDLPGRVPVGVGRMDDAAGHPVGKVGRGDGEHLRSSRSMCGDAGAGASERPSRKPGRSRPSTPLNRGVPRAPGTDVASPSCPPISVVPRARSRRSSELAGAGLPAQQLLEEAARAHRPGRPLGRLLPRRDRSRDDAVHRRGHHPGPAAGPCQPTWDYEFMVPDYLKFADIAHSGRSVADLHEATGGRPERSAAVAGVRRGDRASAPRCARRSRPGRRDVGASASSTASATRRASPTTRRRGSSASRRSSPTACARPCSRSRPARRPTAAQGWCCSTRPGTSSRATPEAAAWLDESRPRTPSRRARIIPIPFEAHALRRARPRGRPRRRRRPVAPGAPVRTRTGVWLLDARLDAGGHRPARADHRAGQGGRRRAADRRGLRPHAARARGDPPRSPAASAPRRSPPSCTSRRTPCATTSRRSSRRSACRAAASSWRRSSPTTTPPCPIWGPTPAAPDRTPRR